MILNTGPVECELIETGFSQAGSLTRDSEYSVSMRTDLRRRGWGLPLILFILFFISPHTGKNTRKERSKTNTVDIYAR